MSKSKCKHKYKDLREAIDFMTQRACPKCILEKIAALDPDDNANLYIAVELAKRCI
jgi:hypothetical protein